MEIYVAADQLGDEIFILNRRLELLDRLRLPPLSGPRRLAAKGDTLYAVCSFSGEVMSAHLPSGQVCFNHIGPYPTDIAFSGEALAAACGDASTISLIDHDDLSILGLTHCGELPLELRGSGGFFSAACFHSGAVQVFDSSLAPVDEIHPGGNVLTAIRGDNGAIYCGIWDGKGWIARLDDGRESFRAETKGAPIAMDIFSEKGILAYSSTDGDGVELIDMHCGEHIASVPTESMVGSVLFAGDCLLMTGTTDARLLLADTDGRILASARIGRGLAGIAAMNLSAAP